MTPKEKANELYNKFYNTDFNGNSIKIRDLLTKECALVAVDEIIDATTKRWGGMNPETGFVVNNVEVNPYWVDVKQEIEKL